MSDFREKCIGKARLIGTFAAIPHPVAVEVTAQSGLDFLCIDWEHAQIARDTIENLVRAADVHRVPAMVRVPGHAPEAIAAALDSGARGVLVPRVSTAAQAEPAVKAARYPPLGERGVGPWTGRRLRLPHPRIPRCRQCGNRGRGPGRDRRRAGECRRRSPRPKASTWCSSVPAISRCRSTPSGRRAPTGSPGRSRRSSAPRWRTARSPASSAQSRRMSADGPPRAPASSSWPATRCSSAPASRQAAPLPAAVCRQRTGLNARR